jgi:hypothetical protein
MYIRVLGNLLLLLSNIIGNIYYRRLYSGLLDIYPISLVYISLTYILSVGYYIPIY